jgi:class 3 adenylate cyclase
MTLADAIRKDVDTVLTARWSLRDGMVVPSTPKVQLSGGGVRLSATMLYADLADSTELAMSKDRRVAAKVFKCFLAVASRLIKRRGGEVRSYDGDRVMGVFLGEGSNARAVDCALTINHAFQEVIAPRLLAKYPSLRSGDYELAHSVGVDTSEVLVVRGGVRQNNDLIWVGRAPNVAAKLSGIRQSPYNTFITPDVYRDLPKDLLSSGEGEKMWQERKWTEVKGVDTIYRSRWSLGF